MGRSSIYRAFPVSLFVLPSAILLLQPLVRQARGAGLDRQASSRQFPWSQGSALLMTTMK